MKIFKEKAYKIMIILTGLMGLVATVGALGNFYQTTDEKLSPLIIIIGVIVGLYFFVRLFKVLDKVSEKKLNKFAVLITLLFFVGLSLFGIRHLIIPTYDLSHVERELNLMMDNGPVITNIGYFGKYTNQVPLTVFLYFVYYIGNVLSIGNLKAFATVVNSLFMAISAYFTFLSIKEIKSAKHGFIGLLFFVLNPIFYMYASYFYTDTLCLPFSSIAIYLLLILNKKNKKVFFSLLLITGFIIAMGMQIRLVVAFVMIAAIVGNFLNEEKLTNTIKVSAFLLIGFILGLVNYTLIAHNFDIPKDDTRAFPITHWVMMGLNDESGGRYNGNDHDYTISFKSKKEKTEANIKVIKNRIKDLGIIGLIKLWGQKIAIAWSNGAYRYVDKIKMVETIRSDFEYISGCNMIFILYYLQIAKSIILVILMYMLFRELKRDNQVPKIKFLYVAIFGAFLFYSIWEVQARYSLSFLPWFIILFPLGIENLSNKQVNNKLAKCFPCLLFATSIILLAINYPKYVIDKDTYVDTRVYQVKSRSEKYKNLNRDVIYQSFITDKAFNTVAISLLVEDDDDNADYKFSLLNENYQEIAAVLFNREELNNGSFKKFRFDTVKVNERTKFYINILPIGEVKNTIGFNSYTYEPYTVYPDGNLIVNGKVTNGAMAFRVEQRHKRSYTNPAIYLSISFIIVAVEAFALMPYRKRK